MILCLLHLTSAKMFLSLLQAQRFLQGAAASLCVVMEKANMDNYASEIPKTSTASEMLAEMRDKISDRAARGGLIVRKSF